MAPLERRSSGRKVRVTLNGPKRLTARLCSMAPALAQIVVESDAGIVDEDVEGVDFVDRPLDSASTLWSHRSVSGVTRFIGGW